MTNKTYDILKYIAQIVLPALGTLYFALSQIWNLPHGEEIVGTITAVDAFLGALLKINSDRYYGITGTGHGDTPDDPMADYDELDDGAWEYVEDDGDE